MVRKYIVADDSLFLERIADGTLRVDPETAEVWTKGCGKGQRSEWQPMTIFRCGRKNEYLCVRVHKNHRRKQITLQRLVWMVVHGLIPEGMDVDHADRDTEHCHIHNLRLRKSEHNRHNSTSFGGNGGQHVGMDASDDF